MVTENEFPEPTLTFCYGPEDDVTLFIDTDGVAKAYRWGEIRLADPQEEELIRSLAEALNF